MEKRRLKEIRTENLNVISSTDLRLAAEEELAAGGDGVYYRAPLLESSCGVPAGELLEVVCFPRTGRAGVAVGEDIAWGDQADNIIRFDTTGGFDLRRWEFIVDNP